MKRFFFAPGCWLLVLLISAPVMGQPAGQDAPAADEATKESGDDGLPEAPPKAPPPSDDTLATKKGELKSTPEDAAAPTVAGKSQVGWKDVVVVQPKAFLKRRRVELTPFYATTVNDTLIQHSAIGLELNYFITDILNIGVLGMYYVSNVLDQEFYTRHHFNVVPTLNRYLYTATLNMGYVPIYGKFDIFNYWILHYEVFATGGVGVTGTEIIPRKLENEAFTNIALTFQVGIGGRIFVNKWLALQVAFRDFMMLDKFEPRGRTQRVVEDPTTGQNVKDAAETSFINNAVLTFGAAVYFPLSFKHATTYR
ncbi:MAG: outer membrane beta-barrel domain-containing protein [Deltaproteobacteria bacterium]|nr:outer membrane beta-barrel domain-containing protein [Deltaproteobacteria bacterium]